MAIEDNELFEYYRLKDGRTIESIYLSKKMFKLIEEAPEKKRKDRLPYSWNESGMADLFGKLYNEDTRYCPEYKTWFTYDKGRWQRDTESLLLSGKIKEFVELLLLYSFEIEDETYQNEFRKFISKMGDRRFRERLMKDARDVLSITASDFDKDPNLINCLNGTFDLSKLEFREHRWQDFITKQTNFDYTWSFNENSKVKDEHLHCKRWEDFIAEITSEQLSDNTYKPNSSKADYLQRALGYSLLGTNREECMFILHGKTTRNGKSTLLDAIDHMLGDYSSNAPVALICKSNFASSAEAPSPVLARLKGRRFVTMAESQESGNLDESIIKQLTGGEEITARELRQEPITFLPQFTLWLSCNSLPSVRDRSLFASDRLRVIEFNRHFGNSERDTSLKELFKTPEAMKGIFTWLVVGYRKYLDKGLTMSIAMQKVINNYVKDNDIVLQFLEEKCERSKDNSQIKVKTLYDSYKIWCKSNGFYVCSSKTFMKNLEAHPDWIKGNSKVQGCQTYRGIKMKQIKEV